MRLRTIAFATAFATLAHVLVGQAPNAKPYPYTLEDHARRDRMPATTPFTRVARTARRAAARRRPRRNASR